MKLQERDIILLKLIAEYGVLNKVTIKYIYKIVRNIIKKKILAGEKYIVKNNKFNYLGI